MRWLVQGCLKMSPQSPIPFFQLRVPIWLTIKAWSLFTLQLFILLTFEEADGEPWLAIKLYRETHRSFFSKQLWQRRTTHWDTHTEINVRENNSDSSTKEPSIYYRLQRAVAHGSWWLADSESSTHFTIPVMQSVWTFCSNSNGN